jgi:hypothetical protein
MTDLILLIAIQDKQTLCFPRLPHNVAASVSNQISTFNGLMSVALPHPISE